MTRGTLAAVVVATSVVLAAFIVVAHLLVGRADLPAGAVVDVLLGRSDDRAAEVIVLRYRLPRVLVGLGAGALLAVSGVLVQAVVGNPLAEPATTGVGPGAALGAVVATMAGREATYPAALAGALTAGVLLLALGRRSPAVVGILLGAVLAAVTALLLVVDSSPTAAVMRWLVGSLNARTAEDWTALWPWLVVLPALAWLLSSWANAWALGVVPATSLGVPVRTVRVVLLALGVVCAGVAIGAAGAVAFVGLVAPHTARLWVGPDHRLLVPVAAALGAVLLAGADLVAFSVGVDLPGTRDVSGVPVGAVTALLGAPVLVHLVRRELR